MTTKNSSKTSPAPKTKPSRKKSRSHRHFSGMEKIQAVLSVWSERRKPSHVCKDLSITWQQLNTWQDKALAAMIEALEPPAPADQNRPPALSDRLSKLLRKQKRKAPAKAAGPEPDLSDRLSKRLSTLAPEENNDPS
jgi:hypothetical protein